MSPCEIPSLSAPPALPPSTPGLEAETGLLIENPSRKPANTPASEWVTRREIEMPDGGIVAFGGTRLPPPRSRKAPAIPHKAIVDALAKVLPASLVDEAWLAEAFGVTTRTIRRMVEHSELPPTRRMSRHKRWMVRLILAHVEARMMRAEAEARRLHE